jgi:PAS domain S-box-containing protein
MQQLDLKTDGKSSPSYAQLCTIVNSAPAHVWTGRADGSGVDFVNKRFTDYTGLSMAQVLGWGWTDAVHPVDRRRILARAESILASGTSQHTEMRLRRFDGTYRWFLFEGSPLHDASGAVVGWCGTNVDVDVRKRAAEALRESVQQLQLIIDSIPGQVAILNTSGQAEMVNRGLLEYFGRPLEDFQFGDTSDHVHPDELADVIAAWVRAMGTGTMVEYEHRLRRYDGVYRWFYARGLPLRDSANQILRWYVLLTDIDDRKRAEDALRDMQTKLSRAAQVATVGELAASVAHEVNQPLAAVVANGHACVRWLSATPPNFDKALEAAQRIAKDGKDAGEVVRRVRSLFKRAAAERLPLDIGDIVRDVLRLLETDAARRSVAVAVTLEPDVPPVLGDRVQLQQLVLNLMLNALDAMEPIVDRPKRLTVGSRCGDAAHVVVEIGDNGVGLEDPHAAFEPFFTTKADGMGMGLAICRSIVAAHNGTLAARRNDDFGTTFWFSLPLEPRVNQ